MEKPDRAYEPGDTNLVSHDVEPAEKFAFRWRGVTADDLWDQEVAEFVTGSSPEIPDGLLTFIEAIESRDSALRLAVLEEAARACGTEADARAVRDLKRRPVPASTS